VQALNLAASLRVVGAGVLELHAEALELVLEQDLAAAIGAREDRAVVREQRGRQAVQLRRLVEARNDVDCFDPRVGIRAQVKARVVVDQVEHLEGAAAAGRRAAMSIPHLS
jgi:hypothetical protein